MLTCKVCNVEFEYLGPRGPEYEAITCSKTCRRKLCGIQAALRRKRPLVTSNCETCGKEMVSAINATTCSRACRAKRLSRLYKGRKLTDEWKSNQNKSKTRDKIVRYGHFSCDTCQKSFETNLSLRAHKSYCSRGVQDTHVSCRVCGKGFKSDRGLKIHLHCHNAEWNEPRRERMRLKALGRKSQKTSKSEVEFFEKLKELFGAGEVVHKFKIDDCSHEYDFFVPSLNLIIEFDGDYWHGNKSLHALTPRMKRQYRVDRAWDEKALRAGYNIKRVWESESKDLRVEKLC